MTQFTKLRLTGFKSFVDAAELHIEPGMTGVVGPNGCGKSNLVEALKWVMGETSAKQMRGGEMDDVIFGGTSDRPARNIAEVSITLDNTKRGLPHFNEFDEVLIARRIERGSGSNYRVNGQNVRARDVQLLFADLATGARSTAMVNQGKVGQLINAKPSQRRSLLEEAAGISGLHTRRHEAELRLRAAEGNLERLEDVLGTLDTQLQGLKRQARQAARYRELSQRIRQTEAVVLHLKWGEAVNLLDIIKEKHKAAEAQVMALTGETASASKAQAQAAAILNPLREAEAEAGAALHRLIVAREQLDEEERRLEGEIRDHEHRLVQIDQDTGREAERKADADEAAKTLDEEAARLTAARDAEGPAREDAKTHLHKVNEEVNAIEADLTKLTEELAAAEARKAATARRIEDAEQRTRRLNGRIEEVSAQRQRALEEAVGKDELADALAAMEQTQADLDKATRAMDLADRARQETQESAEALRDTQRETETALTKLTAEAEALADLLAEGLDGDWPPVLDQLKAKPGYEMALATALGEDLSGSLESEAPRHWTALAPLTDAPPLPQGTFALSHYVDAPGALSRRLSQVGVVEKAEQAEALQKDLKAGQRIVARDGGLWRWDGFTVSAGAPDAAAIRLKQKNRLAELQDQLGTARAAAEKAQADYAAARDAAEAAQAADRQTREETRAAERALSQAREAHGRLEQKMASEQSRIGTIDETLHTLAHELEEVQAQHKEALRAQEDLADQSETREKANDLRTVLAEKRTLLVEARSAYDRISRESEQRRERLDAIERETASWRSRKDSAENAMADLAQRRTQTAEALERLKARPAEIAASRTALADKIEAAEVKRRDAADALAKAEAEQAETDRLLKDRERALATAREERVRREGEVEQGKQACRTIAQRIDEQLGCVPEKVLDEARLSENESLPDLAEGERRLDRAMREREAMGPVNLRAEQEATEMEEQIGGLTTEKDDLVNAIARLRQGIAELNREGRQRLLQSFEEVDRHFRTLFVRLFGGGRAHLALTESDDPLEAGLEIMASPPGKRLQILSLLSGGEQALTALALLFAVFMTNPAPICVLDEVDAPLDDANVDRFCNMLEEIAQGTATRFLCVTHHRMTMARMDRLFGVTMAERGISKLVSVDLQRAAEMAESA